MRAGKCGRVVGVRACKWSKKRKVMYQGNEAEKGRGEGTYARRADCAPGPGVLVLLPPVALILMCTAVTPMSFTFCVSCGLFMSFDFVLFCFVLFVV